MPNKSFTVMEKQHICKQKLTFFVSNSAKRNRQDKYIPPKRPYSFEAMLNDILDFAASSLVDGGRISMWMPTANDEQVELGIPMHPCLEVVSVCVQAFNKCEVKDDLLVLSAIRLLREHNRVEETPYLSKITAY